MPNALPLNDLVAVIGLKSYDLTVKRSGLWRRVGDRLVLERVQEKGWRSYAKAKPHTRMDTKTMQKVEKGAKNVELAKYESYATGVGLKLEDVIADELAVRKNDLTVIERALLAALEDSSDEERQQMLRLLAQPYVQQILRQDSQPSEAPEPQTAIASVRQVSSGGKHGPRRKGRTP